MNRNDNWQNPQDPKRRELTKWEKFKDWFIDRLAYIFVIFAFGVVGITVVIFSIGYLVVILDVFVRWIVFGIIGGSFVTIALVVWWISMIISKKD